MRQIVPTGLNVVLWSLNPVEIFKTKAEASPMYGDTRVRNLNTDLAKDYDLDDHLL